VSARPRSLLACFVDGLCWLWIDARDFLLIFLALALSAIALGAWAANPFLMAGGLALLGLLAAACLAYGRFG
jgi:hypothetical protein